MENQSEINVILETIRKEHRRTQLVFGIGIVILALVVMAIAPISIRTAIQGSSLGNAPYEQESYDVQGRPAPTVMTGSTSITVTP